MLTFVGKLHAHPRIMTDVEAEQQKREEDERLDTAEDPNEEVRHTYNNCVGAKLVASQFGRRYSALEIFSHIQALVK